MQPSYIELIKNTIRDTNLINWLVDFPWLTGRLGNPISSIWFVGENPSLKQVKGVDEFAVTSNIQKTENLQWNSSIADQLLREALTEANLKSGKIDLDQEWDCHITNVIKEPEHVNSRNKKKQDSQYWKTQAITWMPVLQQQIDTGAPKVLVALGGQVEKILNFMKKQGLKSPPIIRIHHYSYIMFRPEAKTKRGPKHPDRISEFKTSIKKIAQMHKAKL